MLGIILGLVLCNLGQSSVVPNEVLLVNEGLISDDTVLIVNESFESVADWDAWTCTRDGIDVKGTVVKRNSGGTPTNNTGPNGAKQGDYYIYYEDTGNNIYNNSGTVICKSPQYISPWNDRCKVYFGVNMYGRDIGNFKFRTKDRLLWWGLGRISWTPTWREMPFSFQPSWNGTFSFEVEMSGGSGYGSFEGDIAFDDLRVYCPKPVAPTNSTVKPTPYPTHPTDGPTHPPTHHTNSTDHPTHPTNDGEGEVRVRFGGLDVSANVPVFEAEEDIGEVAKGVFGMVKNVVMYPFTVLHYLIYGY